MEWSKSGRGNIRGERGREGRRGNMERENVRGERLRGEGRRWGLASRREGGGYSKGVMVGRGDVKRAGVGRGEGRNVYGIISLRGDGWGGKVSDRKPLTHVEGTEEPQGGSSISSPGRRLHHNCHLQSINSI